MYLFHFKLRENVSNDDRSRVREYIFCKERLRQITPDPGRPRDVKLSNARSGSGVSQKKKKKKKKEKIFEELLRWRLIAIRREADACPLPFYAIRFSDQIGPEPVQFGSRDRYQRGADTRRTFSARFINVNPFKCIREYEMKFRSAIIIKIERTIYRSEITFLVTSCRGTRARFNN